MTILHFVLPRALLLAWFTLFCLLSKTAPAYAQMSGEQKDKLRAALPMPKGSFGVNFSFSRKKGFLLTFNGESNTQTLRARLAFLSKYGKPSSPSAQLTYLRKVGDLQDELEKKEAATVTYEKAEKLALELAKSAKSKTEQARYLALAAGFCEEQDKDELAASLAESALKLAPDSWEAWDVKATVVGINDLQSIPAFKGSGDLATGVGQWLNTKPSPETVAKLNAVMQARIEARNKSIQLHEKSISDPTKRDAGLYITRAFLISLNEAINASLKSNETVTAEMFSAELRKRVFSNSTRDDIDAALTCYANDPYSVGVRMFISVATGGNVKEEASKVLPKLKTWEQKAGERDIELRLKVCELRCLVSLVTDDWEKLVTTAEAGLKLSPTRESLQEMYFGGLFKKERFLDAERFLEDPATKVANTKPLFRYALAAVKVKRKDYEAAERILAELAERSDAPVKYTIARVIVRLKATKDDTPEDEWGKISDEIDAIYKISDEKFEREDQIAFATVIAAYNAITGYPDKARSYLNELLESDKDNDDIKEMLAALP